MAPRRHTLEASTRTIIGKEVEKLRRAGQTPGIVYGPVVPTPIPVAVDAKTAQRMYTDFGSNLLINLTIDRATYTVYMRNVDHDRLRRNIRHIEFYAPNLRLAMTTDIPVVFLGEPGEARAVLTRGLERISVQGLPDALPAVIEVDLSNLSAIGQSIHVSDLNLGDDVTVLSGGDELIVRLDAPQMVVAEEPETGAEAEVGEPAAGEGSAEEAAE